MRDIFGQDARTGPTPLSLAMVRYRHAQGELEREEARHVVEQLLGEQGNGVAPAADFGAGTRPPVPVEPSMNDILRASRRGY